jgi:hypothetical protein
MVIAALLCIRLSRWLKVLNVPVSGFVLLEGEDSVKGQLMKREAKKIDGAVPSAYGSEG